MSVRTPVVAVMIMRGIVNTHTKLADECAGTASQQLRGEQHE